MKMEAKWENPVCIEAVLDQISTAKHDSSCTHPSKVEKWGKDEQEGLTMLSHLYCNSMKGVITFETSGQSSESSVNFGDIGDIWDKATIDRINSLHPSIRDSAIRLILDAQSKGIFLRITSGYRSIDEQNKLYAKGAQSLEM